MPSVSTTVFAIWLEYWPDVLIILNEDLVVYKLWGGRPSIDEMEEKKNPLGPAQSSEDFLLDTAIP